MVKCIQKDIAGRKWSLTATKNRQGAGVTGQRRLLGIKTPFGEVALHGRKQGG